MSVNQSPPSAQLQCDAG